MNRRLAREAAMCLFYEREVRKEPGNDTLIEMGDVLERGQFTDTNFDYIDRALTVYEQHLGEIDGMIAPYCHTWKIDRLSRVDISILRLAVAEMYFMEGLPYKVSINEAVEQAKKYSTEKSPAFINGILGALVADNPPSAPEKRKTE